MSKYSFAILVFSLSMSSGTMATEADSLSVDTISSHSITITNIDTLLYNARGLFGIKYKWGGVNKKGFDCSGFTQYVLGQTGVPFPRIASEQFCLGEDVDSLSHVEIGDMMFFKPRNRANRVGHVGIVSKIEGDKIYMIHASSSQGITETCYTDTPYWTSRFFGIKRWWF